MENKANSNRKKPLKLMAEVSDLIKEKKKIRAARELKQKQSEV